MTKIGIYPLVTATGTNTYVATASPVPSAYSEGQRFNIKFTNANTGASTINLNSLGAVSIVKNGTEALESGDISAGQILLIQYDGTNMQIVGGVDGVDAIPIAEDVAFTPAGTIAADNVQDAIEELDSEKIFGTVGVGRIAVGGPVGTKQITGSNNFIWLEDDRRFGIISALSTFIVNPVNSEQATLELQSSLTSNRVWVTPDGVAVSNFDDPSGQVEITNIGPKLRNYTVATVPSAATAGAGTMIYVSNESGGAVMAFSDGTNWRRCTDRQIIS